MVTTRPARIKTINCCEWIARSSQPINDFFVIFTMKDTGQATCHKIHIVTNLPLMKQQMPFGIVVYTCFCQN